MPASASGTMRGAPMLADLWTADAWARRLASGNPVYPFDWAVHYQNGARFQRVCRGIVRTSRDAPLWNVERLRLSVGTGAVTLEVMPPSPNPRALVLRASVVGLLASPAARGVAAFRFGFLDADGEFIGVVLDSAGQVVQSSARFRHPRIGGPQ